MEVDQPVDALNTVTVFLFHHFPALHLLSFFHFLLLYAFYQSSRLEEPFAAVVEETEEDLYKRLKALERELEFLGIQEDYIKEEQKNLKRELLRAQVEVKRIQSVPLVLGQFLEVIDQHHGIVGSTTGSNYYVRILSTIDRLGKDLKDVIQVGLGLNSCCLCIFVFVLFLFSCLKTTRELLKPNTSVALHRHSNALVDILPPEADSR